MAYYISGFCKQWDAKKQTNKYLQGVQQILHLSCEYKSHIKWPVLGYCLMRHQQNNNRGNYLQANEKMFFSVVEWPTRETIMSPHYPPSLSLLSPSSFLSFFSSFLPFFLSLSFFLSFFRMTTRKLLQLRLQVVFLTWSFLSRIVINIYTFIFQCNKDAIMYCTCAYFL